MLDFADGRAQLVAVRALPGGALVGHEIRELRHHLPQRHGSARRRDLPQGQAVKPEGITVIEVDDEVFFLADRKTPSRPDERAALGRRTPDARILIAGGGNIGRNLAQPWKAAIR